MNGLLRSPIKRQGVTFGMRDGRPGWWKRWWPVLLLGCLATLYAAHAEVGAPGVLTTARAVHDLPASDAVRKVPVHLHAVVTYYEPAQSNLFVADQTGAVYVKTNRTYPIEAGDLVEINGVTAKEFTTTVETNPRITVIGRGVMPQTEVRTEQSYGDLMAGRLDCQLVTIAGVVRSAMLVTLDKKQVMELELLLHGGLVQAYVQHPEGLDPETLTDATVEFQGVVAGYFNAKWQLMQTALYAHDRSGVKVVRRAPAKDSAESMGVHTSIDAVNQTRLIEDRSRRVRVEGPVTYYRPGESIVIEQGTSSISATTRYDRPIPLGSLVELSGFAAQGGYVPSMSEVEVLPTGRRAEVTPVAASYNEAVSGRRSDDLVTMRGELLTEQHTGSTDTLFLKVEGHTVPVVLNSPEEGTRLPQIPTGALLSATGICRIDAKWALGAPGDRALLFHLDLRSPEDVQVLAPPSWWTVGHMMMLLAVLLLLALAVAAWAFVLRVRVARQKRATERVMRLERERAKLLEAISSAMPFEELMEAICGLVPGFAPALSYWCRLEEPLVPGEDGSAGASTLGKAADILIVSTPLRDTSGRTMGAFCVGAAGPRRLTAFENEAVAAASSLASLALYQRRMYEELQYRSLHDGLTSLANRRCADQHLEEALEEVRAHGGSLLVAYLDINGFKQVNDQHGHKIGDLYLQQIAKRLSAHKRKGDLLARMGGDEFLLIAKGRSPAEPDGLRERLESAFDEPFSLDGVYVQGSASVGVAVFPIHGESVADLQRFADTQMYAVKHGRKGRNARSYRESVERDLMPAGEG